MATIKDVALHAGVTVTTVSRVLNNRGYISEKTRQKVYESMRALNYQPNELARALYKKQSKVVGVVVPSLLHPYFSACVHYLEKYAARQGYKIMVCNSKRERKSEIEYIEMLKSNKVAGIVLCTRTGELADILDDSLPVVTLERSISDKIPAIMCDNYQGGVLAARCLLDRGRKGIAVFPGQPKVQLPGELRVTGFLDTCRQAGVEPIVVTTDESQFAARDYRGTIRAALRAHPEIDGVFATSDVMAAQVIQECAKVGRSIPQDVSLVGFDDVDIASLTCPPLTTIHQPLEQMCEYAVDGILRKLRGETVPVKTILPVSRVDRESV